METIAPSDVFPYDWDEEIDISWIKEQENRVKCKVVFYNSCGIFKKILFSLIHGRNFVPTQNERRLVYFYNKREEESA